MSVVRHGLIDGQGIKDYLAKKSTRLYFGVCVSKLVSFLLNFNKITFSSNLSFILHISQKPCDRKETKRNSIFEFSAPN